MKYTIYHVLGIKVGCTENFIRRTRENKKTYGKDITIVILQITSDLDQADELENKYSIELGYGEIKPTGRYKVRHRCGRANKGKLRSLETREKMSKAHKGKLVSLETREKISKAQKGKIHTLETKKKMSQSHKGKPKKRMGKLYVEYSTGFIGSCTDIADRFKIAPQSIVVYGKRNKPLSKRPNKGLHFAIYSKDI